MMRLIATVEVGAAWRGHSRSIYGGDGMELWHELIVPRHLGAFLRREALEERVFLYLAELPTSPPPDCKFCGLEEAFYSDAMLPQIHWVGSDCLDRAVSWLGERGVAIS